MGESVQMLLKRTTKGRKKDFNAGTRQAATGKVH